MKIYKETPFEVNCYNLLKENTVTVTNMRTGHKYYCPAIKWEWKNSFYANVTFLFRGQEFTVLAEVNPIINY